MQKIVFPLETKQNSFRNFLVTICFQYIINYQFFFFSFIKKTSIFYNEYVKRRARRKRAI